MINKKVLFYSLIGSAIGSITALLYTSKPGKKFRNNLMHEASGPNNKKREKNTDTINETNTSVLEIHHKADKSLKTGEKYQVKEP